MNKIKTHIGKHAFISPNNEVIVASIPEISRIQGIKATAAYDLVKGNTKTSCNGWKAIINGADKT